MLGMLWIAGQGRGSGTQTRRGLKKKKTSFKKIIL